MKISKYIHSCLLVEEGNKRILIDPGIYTYEAKALDVNSLPQLDSILITHEHPDHMHPPFMKEIVNKFPNAQIITNPAAAELLNKEGLKASSKENDIVKIEEVPHERVFGSEPPKNVLFNIFSKLSHPGDSLHFSLRTPTLALPVQAPWCSLTEAVEKAVSLKPKVIIPVHDWHWNDSARSTFYKRLDGYFGDFGIKFEGLEAGESVEV